MLRSRRQEDRPLGKPTKILVVEDEALLRGEISRSLYAIYPSADIRGMAMWYGLERGFVPDLITMDGNLPGGWGPSIVRELRDGGSVAVIIMVSGDSAALDEGVAAGANGSIDKAKLDPSGVALRAELQRLGLL